MGRPMITGLRPVGRLGLLRRKRSQAFRNLGPSSRTPGFGAPRYGFAFRIRASWEHFGLTTVLKFRLSASIDTYIHARLRDDWSALVLIGSLS